MLLLALSMGEYPISMADIVRFAGVSLGFGSMPAAQYHLLSNILLTVRLPRTLAAALVGFALSSSGASFQAVFRNPLVSPGLLGVLAGAACGAALAMICGGSWWMIQIVSFAMGLLAVALGVGIGAMFGGASIVTLMLGGIISGTAFGAALSVIKYVADPQDQLPSIVFWLMGSFDAARLPQVGWLALPILLAGVLLAFLGRALDVMSMGDDEARTLGIPVDLVRYGVIAIATLVSALSVSIAGMIGWVGLLIPHIARLLLGSSNSRLISASALLGASFMIAADCLSRNLGRVEIPVGIVTECLGVPAFIVVLHRSRRAWR